ncbi:MAG TPA: hypothetical protein VHV32_05855 [Candidatus Angelobacter sp.]|nr:hypothetical protein [Candidatus Angelobacter sp.]
MIDDSQALSGNHGAKIGGREKTLQVCSKPAFHLRGVNRLSAGVNSETKTSVNEVV